MAEHRRLYDGARNTGLTVRPSGKVKDPAWLYAMRVTFGPASTAAPSFDPQWQGMWRIHYPDGTVSDMVNISRATDAAVVWLRRTSGQSSQNFRWKSAESPPEPGTAAQLLARKADPPHG